MPPKKKKELVEEQDATSSSVAKTIELTYFDDKAVNPQEEKENNEDNTFPKCICVGYEGQGWKCPEHEIIHQCLYCNQVGNYKRIKSHSNPDVFRCNWCGKNFGRDMRTGEYYHNGTF